MNILRILLVLLSLSIAGSTNAQGILMRLGNNHMKNLNYQAAIEAYKKVLEKEDNGEAKINLAESYRKLSDTQNAEQWYSQVVQMTSIESKQYLYYAQMLQQNGKCEQAKKWFQRYAEAAPDDTRGQYLARSCDYVGELMTKNATHYEVQRLWFNSPNDDFSPFYYRDGLIFASERKVEKYVKRSSSSSNKPFLKLFFVQMLSSNIESPNSPSCDFIYGKPKMFSEELGTRYHEASAVFTADEREVFFTRSTTGEDLGANNGNSLVYRLQLYHSEWMGESWSKPQSLSFNSRTYSCAHPALSEDGRFLFFSADIPGGYGGMDLYMVERVGKRWGQPINLGSQINTEGNEVFPTVDQSGRIYFASDGQIGLGGLDVYYTEELEKDLWSTPENLGYPINTIADDFGMVFDIDGTCGYFTSNRAGGAGGDDIYTFTKQSASIQVRIVDAETKAPIGNIMVEENCNNDAFMTNANGVVLFDLARGSCCQFQVEADNYYPNQLNKCLNDLKAVDKNTITIELRPRLNFGIKGVIFDELTGLPLQAVKVKLINDCGDTEAAAFVTTTQGRFEFPIRSNCCYSIAVEHSEYNSSMQEGHCTRGLKSSKTLSTKFYLQRK